MAGHQEHHHPVQQKPVAFTVPLILAAVTVLVIFLFVSLCDPRPHTKGEHYHNSHNATGTQQNDGHRNAGDENNIKSHGEAKGPDAVPATQGAGENQNSH